jgi:hypothetical protein
MGFNLALKAMFITTQTNSMEATWNLYLALSLITTGCPFYLVPDQGSFIAYEDCIFREFRALQDMSVKCGILYCRGKKRTLNLRRVLAAVMLKDTRKWTRWIINALLNSYYVQTFVWTSYNTRTIFYTVAFSNIENYVHMVKGKTEISCKSSVLWELRRPLNR